MKTSLSTAEIWDQLGAPLRGFFRKRVANDHDADDLVQETFLKIHSKIGGLGDTQRLTSWVFQIARNQLTDYYRAKARNNRVNESSLPAFEAKDDKNLNQVISGWLPSMVDQLPEPYRQAIRLYEFEGHSQQQIADQLELSLSGAKSRIQRARSKLASLLHECCTIERDRRGNAISYTQKSSQECPPCQP